MKRVSLDVNAHGGSPHKDIRYSKFSQVRRDNFVKSKNPKVYQGLNNCLVAKKKHVQKIDFKPLTPQSRPHVQRESFRDIKNLLSVVSEVEPLGQIPRPLEYYWLTSSIQWCRSQGGPLQHFRLGSVDPSLNFAETFNSLYPNMLIPLIYSRREIIEKFTFTNNLGPSLFIVPKSSQKVKFPLFSAWHIEYVDRVNVLFL